MLYQLSQPTNPLLRLAQDAQDSEMFSIYKAAFKDSSGACMLLKDGVLIDVNANARDCLGLHIGDQMPSFMELSAPIQDGNLSLQHRMRQVELEVMSYGICECFWVFRSVDNKNSVEKVAFTGIGNYQDNLIKISWEPHHKEKLVAFHRDSILSMMAQNLPIADVLQAIAGHLESRFQGFSCAIIRCKSGKGYEVVSHSGLPAHIAVHIQSLESSIAFDKQLLDRPSFIRDLTGHSTLKSLAEIDPAITCFWSVPIATGSHPWSGALALFGNTNRRPTEDEIGLIESDASLTKLILDKSLTEERVNLAASVFTNTREGLLILDPSGIIVDANQSYTRITGFEKEDVIGKPPTFFFSHESSPVQNEIHIALAEHGYWTGETWSKRKNGSDIAESVTVSEVRDSNGILLNYVVLLADITTIKQHQIDLERVAHYDALTGLPNRVLLADRLRMAINQADRRQTRLAVVYLDLDGFKSVNDTYGHSVGDKLLIKVSQRMKAALRDCDTLSRVGGDEFIGILTDIGEGDEYLGVLERLLKAASSPLTVENHLLQVSASIGVSIFPADKGDADQLVRHADQAMYKAKQGGKNRYCVFDVDLNFAEQSQIIELHRIQTALVQGEFVLFYQPKVNMRTGGVIGVEALIRWAHPEKGLMPPSTFLPLIENTPLSGQLGRWVIRSALDQMTRWQQHGFGVAISVNITAGLMQESDFINFMRRALSDHPEISPECLELEILETSAMEDIVQISKVMQDCHQMGLRFALDDFGTGYSSLTYLKHLPAEVLKIDQSFIRDMRHDSDDMAIVKSIIGLSKAFNRQVIAEGVESTEIGNILVSLGCDYAQGYAYSRPLPACDIPNWIADFETRHKHI